VTFTKMRSIALDPGVVAYWSSNGQLRFRRVDEPTIRRVHDVLDSMAHILA
jgi:hypothetical protein